MACTCSGACWGDVSTAWPLLAWLGAPGIGEKECVPIVPTDVFLDGDRPEGANEEVSGTGDDMIAVCVEAVSTDCGPFVGSGGSSKPRILAGNSSSPPAHTLTQPEIVYYPYRQAVYQQCQHLSAHEQEFNQVSQ